MIHEEEYVLARVHAEYFRALSGPSTLLPCQTCGELCPRCRSSCNMLGHHQCHMCDDMSCRVRTYEVFKRVVTELPPDELNMLSVSRQRLTATVNTSSPRLRFIATLTSHLQRATRQELFQYWKEYTELEVIFNYRDTALSLSFVNVQKERFLHEVFDTWRGRWNWEAKPLGCSGNPVRRRCYTLWHAARIFGWSQYSMHQLYEHLRHDFRRWRRFVTQERGQNSWNEIMVSSLREVVFERLLHCIFDAWCDRDPVAVFAGLILERDGQPMFHTIWHARRYYGWSLAAESITTDEGFVTLIL